MSCGCKSRRHRSSLTSSLKQQSDEDIDSDEDFDSYDDTGFYEIIQRPDNTLEENYQKLTDSEKQEMSELSNGITRMDFCMQQMKSIRVCINGTAQYYP